MKILIDMNLSPDWQPVLKPAGYDSIHWSKVGPHNASDKEIMEWAHTNKYAVFTHDLDFGAILASNENFLVSVIQVRTQDVSPNKISNIVLSSLMQFEKQLNEGALLTINERQGRARLLPLQR